MPGKLGPREALRMAIEDLVATFGDRYPRGADYLARLEALPAGKNSQELNQLRTEALLDNPMLTDAAGVVFVGPGRASPAYEGQVYIGKDIGLLSPIKPDGEVTWIVNGNVGTIDLHHTAEKLLFCTGGHIFEIGMDGSGRRQVTRREHTAGNNFTPIYLPDGRILFSSDRMLHGIPCLGGNPPVAGLFSMKSDGTDVRQLTWDQDHNWDPVVTCQGRVIFTRWEYTDTPHYHTRHIFIMNPDGTGQMSLYGRKLETYWPNSVFFARSIPGNSDRFVGIVTGHHARRQGAMYLFDTGRSSVEHKAVVQRIPPGSQHLSKSWRNQNSKDGFSCNPWYAYPYPLFDPVSGRGTGKHFLVSSQNALHLVDVFGNRVLIRGGVSQSLLVAPRPKPPIIPDRTDWTRNDAQVYLTDIYAGPGLSGVPRGTIKRLRLFEYHYGYRRVAHPRANGPEGPWEPRRILGTVPVEPDGSAHFTVPALTPIAVQPLDKEGKAVQIMRSWLTAMPGEKVSCVGCHESIQDAPPVNVVPAAFQREPDDIQPWYGPARGFSFRCEVQPVLDKYCVGCHDGSRGKTRTARPIPTLTSRPRFVFPGHQGKKIKNLAEANIMKDEIGTVIHPEIANFESGGWKGYDLSCLVLQRYIHRPLAENDYVMPPPGDFYADLSPLVQLLRSGHGGVTLDREAWDRLITWIDLNGPMIGSWGEAVNIPGKGENTYHRIRMEMRRKYANVTVDPETIPDTPAELGPAVNPRLPAPPPLPDCPDWPFKDAQPRQKRAAPDGRTIREVTIGTGPDGKPVTLKMVLIPAGEFVMGAVDGRVNARPPTRVRIAEPFWMGAAEISNEQYALFDADHDSRYWNEGGQNQTTRGVPLNSPKQPVVRVSWTRAAAFCRWLSKTTGLRVTLPTEAQWEWACRAGSANVFWHGGYEADYTLMANLADTSFYNHYKGGSVTMLTRIADLRFDDKAVVTTSTEGGNFKPNSWGLYHMHGNVAEWTRTLARPYPYRADDGRNDDKAAGRRVVRGGSFNDVPEAARASTRLDIHPWHGSFYVGFRVVARVDGTPP